MLPSLALAAPPSLPRWKGKPLSDVLTAPGVHDSGGCLFQNQTYDRAARALVEVPAQGIVCENEDFGA